MTPFFFLLPQPLFLSSVLTLSGFASLFEVLMGAGFALYFLTKVEQNFKAIFGVAPLEQYLIETAIDSIEFAQQTAKEVPSNKDKLIISQLENKLRDIKNTIEQKRTQIMQNARFSCLLLGVYTLLMLVMTGLEDFCTDDNEVRVSGFHFALFFISLYFGFAWIWLHYSEPPASNRPYSLMTHALALVFLMSASAVLLYFNSKLTVAFPAVAVVLLGVFVAGLPFLLILTRNRRYARFLQHQKFGEQIEDIYNRLLQMKLEYGKK